MAEGENYAGKRDCLIGVSVLKTKKNIGLKRAKRLANLSAFVYDTQCAQE
jgi:hypothetical protein